MDEIKLEIGGNRHSFRDIWVHLQSIRIVDPAEYRIFVPAKYIRKVFDPYNTKEPHTSWTEFIQSLVSNLGTFIVQGFTDTLGEIVGEREKAYRWVIATVDEAVETPNGIELIGRAVPLNPSLY